MLTWDENKRHSNLAKHGIDFAELDDIFDGNMVTELDASPTGNELRLRSLCWFKNRVVVLVWIAQPDSARIISCRKGDKHETRTYFQRCVFFH